MVTSKPYLNAFSISDHQEILTQLESRPLESRQNFSLIQQSD